MLCVLKRMNRKLFITPISAVLPVGNTGKIEYSYNKLKQEYKMDLKTHSLTVLSVSKDDIANYTCVKHFIKSPNTNVMKENKTTELIVQGKWMFK